MSRPEGLGETTTEITAAQSKMLDLLVSGVGEQIDVGELHLLAEFSAFVVARLGIDASNHALEAAFLALTLRNGAASGEWPDSVLTREETYGLMEQWLDTFDVSSTIHGVSVPDHFRQNG